MLDALLAMFETEPLGEDAMREAVALANELGDPSLAQDLLRRAVERDEAGEGLDPGLGKPGSCGIWKPGSPGMVEAGAGCVAVGAGWVG